VAHNGHAVRDILKTLKLGDIEKQLNSATKSTFVSEREQNMRDAADIGDLIQKTRTYSGATVPGSGAIAAVLLDDDAWHNARPATGESWTVSAIQIENIDPGAAAVVKVQLFDGTNACQIHDASLAAATTLVLGPSSASPALNLQLTNAMYLRALQDGSSVTINVNLAYTQDVI